MKCLFKVLIFFVVLIAIVAIAAGVLVTRTPRQLKIQDKAFMGGESFESLGLADTKFIDIYKSYKNLSKIEESDVVHNPYNSTEESPKLHANTQNSDFNEAEMSTLATKKIIYNNVYMITYDDTTLAHLTNEAIKQAKGGNNTLNNMGFTVNELTIINDTKTLRFVVSIDTPEESRKIPLVKVPEKIYAVVYLEIQFVDGKVLLVGKELKINDKDDPVVAAILGKILKNQYGERASTPAEGIKLLMKDSGDQVSEVVNNIGKLGVGTPLAGEAEESTQKKVDPSTITYGLVGVAEHKLSFIGHTALPPV